MSPLSSAFNPYHNEAVSTGISIRDRIWMLQMAQREHVLTKPPINGIALVLPKPLPGDDSCHADPSTLPSLMESYSLQTDENENAHNCQDNNTSPKKAASLLCILPGWASGRRLRRRKRTPKVVVVVTKESTSPGDAGTVRLLDEGSQGEWS